MERLDYRLHIIMIHQISPSSISKIWSIESTSMGNIHSFDVVSSKSLRGRNFTVNIIIVNRIILDAVPSSRYTGVILIKKVFNCTKKMTNTKVRKKNKKKPVPLTQRPVIMKSRKRARHITTQFHKLTHERERAMQSGDKTTVSQLDEALHAMGGRSEYQRASQLSTSFHSTSKWVLGNLARKGWLYGIPNRQQTIQVEMIQSHENYHDDRLESWK